MECLRELHLPTFRESFEDVARRAVQESLSYEQYLGELAEQECQVRRTNRIERWLRDSDLPVEKSLARFDMKRLPAKVARQVRMLLDGAFVDARENVLAFGRSGSGKTHLLCGIAQELVRSGRKVLFGPCSLLVQDLLIAKRDLKLSRYLKRLSEVRGAHHRRSGLRSTEPGGDGSVIHTAGGAVRARQRDDHEQSAVLEMGEHFQGPDDHRGGDRPVGPP